jgi:hypothetical protein
VPGYEHALLDKLYYREIGSCAHVGYASPGYRVVTPDGKFFGFDWSYAPSTMEQWYCSIETETTFVR